MTVASWNVWKRREERNFKCHLTVKSRAMHGIGASLSHLSQITRNWSTERERVKERGNDRADIQ